MMRQLKPMAYMSAEIEMSMPLDWIERRNTINEVSVGLAPTEGDRWLAIYKHVIGDLRERVYGD